MTTRYERLSSRSRRLEVVSLVATAVFTVVMCRLVPQQTAEATLSSTATVGFTAAARLGGDADAGPSGRDARPLPRSAPVHVRIPGTGVDADVRTAEGEGKKPPAVPDDPMQVVWDAAGPAPGELGAALLVGHLDSEAGPAAFAGLSGLRTGTRIVVGRADGPTAHFEVYAVERFGKAGPPDDLLLSDASGEAGPRLLLVARGGAWTKGAADDASVVVSARARR